MLTTTRPLPKKMTESGRIRIGERVALASGKGTRPNKLDIFRLTSPNKPLLHCAANLYGGEVRAWEGDGAPDGQFELYTTVNAMDVLVPTASAISVSYEQWRAGGCVRRCTGDFISHSPLEESLIGQACLCPMDDHDRADAAKTGKACARILRLNVILPDLPGLGLWRLETTGFYATAELLSSLEMLQMGEHQLVEAALRLEWRTVKRYANGKSTPLQFAVPVLWPKYTPRQLLATADQRFLLMARPVQIPEQSSGAQAADDIYGDGGGDRLRLAAGNAPSVSQVAIAPLDARVDTPHPPTGDSGAQEMINEIDAAWRAFGLDDAQLFSYWAKTCNGEGCADRTQIPGSRLPKLLDDARNWIARQKPRHANAAPVVAGVRMGGASVTDDAEDLDAALQAFDGPEPSTPLEDC